MIKMLFVEFEAGKILSTSTGTTITHQIPTLFKALKVNIRPQNQYYQQIWREAQSANSTLVEDYLRVRHCIMRHPNNFCPVWYALFLNDLIKHS